MYYNILLTTGTIYFSDSSAIQPIFNPAMGHWDTLTAYMLDLLTGNPTGRLVRYKDRTTHVLTTVRLNKLLHRANIPYV